MKRILTAGVAALALGGCASLRALPAGPLGQPGPLALSQPLPATSAGEEPACNRELSTGSHIPREVCRTTVKQERDRLGAEDLLRWGLWHGTVIIR